MSGRDVEDDGQAESPTGVTESGSEAPGYAVVRTRILVPIVILSFLVLPFVAAFFWRDAFEVRDHLRLVNLLPGILSYMLLGVLLYWASLKAGVAHRFTFGRLPERPGAASFLLLGVPLVGISFLCLYIVFLPLSYIVPDLVQNMVLKELVLFSWNGAPDAILANIVSILVIVVLAPVMEEIFFRGFLLNRLNAKYGPVRAVVLSSLLFGLLHANILGATLLGAMLAIVHFRTRSLVAPILAHAGNNAVGFLLYLAAASGTRSYGVGLIDEFQAGWWTALVGAAVGIPWLIWFYRTYLVS